MKVPAPSHWWKTLHIRAGCCCCCCYMLLFYDFDLWRISGKILGDPWISRISLMLIETHLPYQNNQMDTPIPYNTVLSSLTPPNQTAAHAMKYCTHVFFLDVLLCFVLHWGFYNIFINVKEKYFHSILPSLMCTIPKGVLQWPCKNSVCQMPNLSCEQYCHLVVQNQNLPPIARHSFNKYIEYVWPNSVFGCQVCTKCITILLWQIYKISNLFSFESHSWRLILIA